MAETVYEMMMKLGIDHTGAMIGLNAIGARLVRLVSQTNEATLALKGLGLIVVGGATLISLEKLIMTAAKFRSEMVGLKTLGGDMEKMVNSGAMDKKIFDVAKITGQKVEDIAKIAGFASSILDPKNTEKALADLSKFSIIQTDKVDDQGNAIKNVIRSGMITGRITDPKTGDIDMERLHNFLDEFQRLKQATHGAFNENVLYGMAKQGGGYLRGLSTEGMEHMAIIAQSLGGPRTGTAFLGIYEQLARGQMTKKTAEGMEEAGLLKPGQWAMDKNVVKLEPEVSKALTAKFGSDPLALAKEIRENLIKQGITDPQEQMRITANAFGRQTTRRFMSEEVADYQQMIGEGKRLGQAYGVDKTFDLKLAEDVTFNMQRLENAWHNMLVAFADPQSEAFIQILQRLRGFISGITDSLKDANVETLTNITRGLAGLGVALMAGGMVAVIAAIGPMGWLVGGLVGLAAINWTKMQGFIDFCNAIIGMMRSMDKMTEGGANRPDVWLSNKLKKMFEGENPNLPNPWTLPAPIAPKTTPEEDDLKKWFVPTNFNPGGGNQKQILQPIKIDLNMDGRTLAQAVSEILEDLYTHPTGPPEANGWDHFRTQGRWDST